MGSLSPFLSLIMAATVGKGNILLVTIIIRLGKWNKQKRKDKMEIVFLRGKFSC